MTSNKNTTTSALSAIELISGASDGVVLRDSMFELRIMLPSIDHDKPHKKRLYFGYFNNAKLAYEALEEFGGFHDWIGAYITLHTVNNSRWSHSPNAFMRSASGLSTDSSVIVKRQWIVVDLDPNRDPKEQPSSDEEKLSAWESLELIKRYCMVRGMPEPIVADSGNGYHLLWKCDIPVESTVHKRMLIELASKFNSPKLTVDNAISDAPRIWKIYGTLTRKGKSTPDRPFRYSKIISMPETLEVINEQRINVWIPKYGQEALVKIYDIDGSFRTIGVASDSRVDKLGVGDNFNPGVLLPEKFNPIEKARSWGLVPLVPINKHGLRVYELKTCPCPRKLTDRSSAIYVLDGGNGGISFNCQHDTCEYSKNGGNRWKELRDKFDIRQPALPTPTIRDIVRISPRLSIHKSLESAEISRAEILRIERLIEASESHASRGQVHKVKAEPIVATSYDLDDLDTSGPKETLELDLSGILCDLENNTEDAEIVAGKKLSLTGADDSGEAEVFRPVNMNNKIMRARDGRRMINVKSDYKEIYDQTFEEICLNPNVYTSQGSIAYVDTEKSCMSVFDQSGLDRLAWRCCEFVEFKKTIAGYVSKPSSSPTRVIAALKDLDHIDRQHIREISQVVKSQFFTESGDLVIEKGYNRESRTYLIECPEILEVESVEHALGFLNNLVSDFPFQSDSERANFLGTWLTPMVRAMIRGPVPMTVIEANKRGTGKTKLAQVVQATYGLSPEVGGLSQDEAEVEKAMLSILNEAQPIHIFDNVKHSVNSACLDRTLTTGFYSARILGQTKNLHREVKQLFILTANNSRMSEDMSRRFTRVRLRTTLKNPERRSDIKNPDLLPWITENRGHVLSCLAVLVKDWLKNDRPCPSKVPRLGSYESWRSVIGGIMFNAGQTEWMANLEESVRDALILDEWDTLVDRWWNEIGLKAPVVKSKLTNLVDLCLKHGILGNLMSGDQSQRMYKLRMAMIDRRDTVIGDFRLKIEQNGGNKTYDYIIEKIEAQKSD